MPGVTAEKIVPLMDQGEPSKIVRLVQGIPADKLLAVLGSIETSGVIRLLENTNADFAVRLFNGPLESVIAAMAGGFADVMADRHIAEFVKHSTDTLQAGLAKADGVIARGLQVRGADSGDGYKFGDLTRGLLSMGQEGYEKGKELVELESKALQEGWEAWQKDVAIKTESLQQQVDQQMQKMSNSLDHNTQLLKEGLAKGKRKLSAFSCNNTAAYQKGLQEEENF